MESNDSWGHLLSDEFHPNRTNHNRFVTLLVQWPAFDRRSKRNTVNFVRLAYIAQTLTAVSPTACWLKIKQRIRQSSLSLNLPKFAELTGVRKFDDLFIFRYVVSLFSSFERSMRKLKPTENLAKSLFGTHVPL